MISYTYICVFACLNVIAAYISGQTSAQRTTSVKAVVGNNVRLDCNTTTDADVCWTHSGTTDSERHLVYSKGEIFNGYRGQFEVQRSRKNTFLYIKEVQPINAGQYRCVEDNGEGLYEITYHLTVLTDSTDLGATTEILPVSSALVKEAGMLFLFTISYPNVNCYHYLNWLATFPMTFRIFYGDVKNVTITTT
jgi:hypothetical protein